MQLAELQQLFHIGTLDCESWSAGAMCKGLGLVLLQGLSQRLDQLGAESAEVNLCNIVALFDLCSRPGNPWLPMHPSILGIWLLLDMRPGLFAFEEM